MIHYFYKIIPITIVFFITSIICAQQKTVLVDFGTSTTVVPWNTLSNPVSGVIDNLKDTSMEATGIRLFVSDAFSNINQSGTTESSLLDYSSLVSNDSFYGNAQSFAGAIEPTAGITLEGLDPEKDYEFTFFASRMGAADVRETQYDITGTTTLTRVLDVSQNTNTLVTAHMKPRADGTISIAVSAGANNTNSFGFFYLGAMTLTFEGDARPVNEETVLVDFGSVASAAPWHTISNPQSGEVTNLKSTSGRLSGIGVAITDAFNGVNTNGTTSTTEILELPATASGDSFYGNTSLFGGQVEATGGITFYNLDSSKTYTLSLFASRMGVTDQRDTKYEVSGAEAKIATLNVSNNTDERIVLTMEPDAEGRITVTAAPAVTNTNTFGFYYLGAVGLTYASTLEIDPKLQVLAPTGGELWQVGKSPEIQWASQDITTVTLEYSVDNGNSWFLIDTVAAAAQSYQWDIPDNQSANCLVRVSSGDIMAESPSVFEISEAGISCPIVIVGSSTAAGTGASSLQNSWVERYKKALFQKNTRYAITNLAKGGYSTYEVLPTGTEIPAHRAVSIDVERNITKAIALNPFGVIVNLPSNDTAKGYTVTEQMDNYATIVNTARDAGIRVWIATPQPRNFPFPHFFETQLVVRDALMATYGDQVIDFWSVSAATDGTIKAALNSGDGIHLNDRGHELLFQQTFAKNIQEIDCGVSTSKVKQTDKVGKITTNEFYPNPFKEDLFLTYKATMPGVLEVHLYDITSKRIFQQVLMVSSAGVKRLKLKMDKIAHLESKLLFAKVSFKTKAGTSFKTVKLLRE